MMAAMQKLGIEIVIDESVVKRETESVMATEFFQSLMNQPAAMRRSSA